VGKDRTKEEQESDIYKPYLEYLNASSTESKYICFLKFWDEICQWDWYKERFRGGPFSIDEIKEAIEEDVLKIRKMEREVFFPYLKKAMNAMIENYIFKAHSENFSVSKFWDAICRWDCYIKRYKGCPCNSEIEQALKRVLKKRKIEREGFFKYLKEALKNAKWEYHDKGKFLEKPKDIYDPKEHKHIWKDLVKTQAARGRELSNNEKTVLISEWKGISEDKAREIIDNKQIFDGKPSSLDAETNSNDADDTDSRNRYEFVESKAIDPQVEHIAEFNGQILCNAVESTIKSYQKRKQRVIRALLTLHCVDNRKDYSELRPVLDSEILELCKTKRWRCTVCGYVHTGNQDPAQCPECKVPGKFKEEDYKPEEIYEKYYEADENSAKTSASNLKNEFLVDLFIYLIAKSDKQTLSDAVESTIKSKPEKEGKCCKELFTLNCYKKKEYLLFDEMRPVLDSEILELCTKKGKKPTYKGIYTNYYPGTKDARNKADAMLKGFRADLKDYLEKNDHNLSNKLLNFEQSGHLH